jgi:hypothetical protein
MAFIFKSTLLPDQSEPVHVSEGGRGAEGRAMLVISVLLQRCERRETSLRLTLNGSGINCVMNRIALCFYA